MTQPSTKKIAFASFIGTAIEFYDFYIYAMAAALVIGEVFFSSSEPAVQSLNAFVTFGLAFIARPFGAILFGHFGDKVGRKATLAASLLVMGISTLLIGLLPSYDSIGVAAPVLLCLLRMGQGIGLGGEWGGAALLATEHAPTDKKAWFGMFPQLGPSVGFLLATLSFLGLTFFLTEAQFKTWGWRLPFIASALLVGIGLYVRLKLTETPAFTQALNAQSTLSLPIKTLLRQSFKPIILGAMAMVVCYNLFYTAAVFCLRYGTQALGIAKTDFLFMLCVAVIFMGLATPFSAKLADQFGRRPVMMIGSLMAIGLGFLMEPLMQSGSIVWITVFLSLTLWLMGITFAPMGAFLPEQFPVAVRYSGAGLSYQLGGILGASFAPAISQWLTLQGGLSWVGFYLSSMATVSFIAVWLMRETKSTVL